MMIEWLKMWFDNRFPRKAKPSVGLFALLTPDQKVAVNKQNEGE